MSPPSSLTSFLHPSFPPFLPPREGGQREVGDGEGGERKGGEEWMDRGREREIVSQSVYE